MKKCCHWMTIGAVLMIGLAGCGGSASDRSEVGDETAASVPASASAETSTPADAVVVFLDAVRRGDDVQTAQMLTTLARQKVAEMDMGVAPPGSDTADFEVGDVEWLGDEGARVASRWTDQDGYGARQTHDMVWMLRREAAGWRIAGVAAEVFDGEPPLLLNFEDPEEMIRKQDLLAEEVARRLQREGTEGPPHQPPPQSHEMSAARQSHHPETASRPGEPLSGGNLQSTRSEWR